METSSSDFPTTTFLRLLLLATVELRAMGPRAVTDKAAKTRTNPTLVSGGHTPLSNTVDPALFRLSLTSANSSSGRHSNGYHVCICIYPPQFHELRVKGLGYMNLEIRVPNFPNSAGPSRLGLVGKLGNWEVCTSTNFPISQIVLGHLAGSFRKLGNWEVPTSTNFPISRFPKWCWAIWAGII